MFLTSARRRVCLIIALAALASGLATEPAAGAPARTPTTVIAEVAKLHARIGPDEDIVTTTKLRVSKIESGDAPRYVTVRSLGGIVGARGEHVSGEPWFEEGQRSLLRLRPVNGIYEVIGGSDGQVVLSSKSGPKGASKGKADGCTSTAGYCRLPYRWSANAMPVSFYVNEGRQPVDNSAVDMLHAWKAWVDDPGSNVTTRYLGKTSNRTWADDGVNIIAWTRDNREWLARTRSWFNPQTGITHGFDTQFNTRYRWAYNGARNKYDVQTVATHEFGHALGLGHVRDREQVMFWTFKEGQIKRNLRWGDINGVRALFPPPPPPPPPPPADIVSYDCRSGNNDPHYVPTPRYWNNEFVAKSSTITHGYVLIGAANDGRPHQARIGISRNLATQSTPAQWVASTTANVSGFGGVNWRLPSAAAVTKGTRYYLTVQAINGDFNAYDNLDQGDCFIGRVVGR